MKLKPMHILAIFIVLGFLLRLYCIDCYNLSFGGDESDYARVARGVTNGCIIISHYYMPAGFMYIEALSFLVLGASEFSARLVSVLFGLFSAVVLFYMVKMLYDKRKALMASLLFIFTPFIMLENRVANTDSVLLFFILLTLYFTLLFWRTRKNRHFYFSLIFFGIGINVKPSIYLIIPVIFFIYWLHRKEVRKEITLKKIVAGLAIVLLFLLPTLLMNIGSLLLGRPGFLFSYGSSINVIPFRSLWFYSGSLIDVMSLPIALFFAVSMIFVLWKKRDTNALIFFFFGVIFFLFFTSAEKAYVRYLLPLMAPLCIFGAIFLDWMKKNGFIVLAIFIVISALFFINTVNEEGYRSLYYGKLRERTGWNELSAFLIENTGQDDVIIGSQPMIEFYTSRQGLNLDDNTVKNPPINAKFIVKEEGHMDEFGAYLEEHYTLVKEMGRFRIYLPDAAERSEPVKILPLCIGYYLNNMLTKGSWL